MTITFHDLIDLLTLQCASNDDTSANEALYLEFGGKNAPRHVKDTITFHTVDGSIVAIDVDERGDILGIELL